MIIGQVETYPRSSVRCLETAFLDLCLIVARIKLQSTYGIGILYVHIKDFATRITISFTSFGDV